MTNLFSAVTQTYCRNSTISLACPLNNEHLPITSASHLRHLLDQLDIVINPFHPRLAEVSCSSNCGDTADETTAQGITSMQLFLISAGSVILKLGCFRSSRRAFCVDLLLPLLAFPLWDVKLLRNRLPEPTRLFSKASSLICPVAPANGLSESLAVKLTTQWTLVTPMFGLVDEGGRSLQTLPSTRHAFKPASAIERLGPVGRSLLPSTT